MDENNYYVSGNAVTNPKPYKEAPGSKEYERFKKAKIQKENRQKHKKNLQKRKTILSVIGVFALGIMLMYNQSKVYSKQMKLTGLTKNIAESKLSYENSQMKLYKLGDMETIRKNAESKAGMVSLKKKKPVYVDFSKNYFKPKTSEAKMSKTKELFLKLKDLLF